MSARQLQKKYAYSLDDDYPMYVPPVPLVFNLGVREIDLQRLKV
jgi:hypothetical protein